MFVLEIETGNAAKRRSRASSGGPSRSSKAAFQVESAGGITLSDVKANVEALGGAKLQDLNGNTVGAWNLTFEAVAR